AQRIRTRCVDQQPTLDGLTDDARSYRAPKIKREKQALAANLAALVRAREFFQAFGEILSHRRDAREEARFGDLVHDRASDCGREGVAAESAALVAMLEATDILMRDQRGERNAAAKSFAQSHDVRQHTRVLEAEEFSCSANPGLNLVENQQDAL